MNMDNEHYTEKGQLLLKKKHLEQRIAEHGAILKDNLRDSGPKNPLNLEKVRAIVTDAERDLVEVNRRLGLLP